MTYLKLTPIAYLGFKPRTSLTSDRRRGGTPTDYVAADRLISLDGGRSSSQNDLLTTSQCDSRTEHPPRRRHRGANPRPSDYKSATLPLSYEGGITFLPGIVTTSSCRRPGVLPPSSRRRPGILPPSSSCRFRNLSASFYRPDSGPTRVDQSKRAIEEIWAALNRELLRADEVEARWVWSSAGMQWRGKRENSEKTQRLRHDSHMRKSGGDPAGNRARCAVVGRE
ncbi:hypothetical protein PR048_002644 [Dryococelus australis]|uniref:Uncharacterized protein n=1 Tax=Dryococelus australis TaxID=614101 RepID=A0ABQ9IKR9_9NEOP|nr:hypothetical protein PR048_002644 [Dryococelus australis]